MLDWPNEGTGGCACIFERKEYCGVAEPIEWCAHHSKLRNDNARLRDALLDIHDNPDAARLKAAAALGPNKSKLSGGESEA